MIELNKAISSVEITNLVNVFLLNRFLMIVMMSTWQWRKSLTSTRVANKANLLVKKLVTNKKEKYKMNRSTQTYKIKVTLIKESLLTNS